MIAFPHVLALTLLAVAIAVVRPRWGFAAAFALMPLGAGAAMILTSVGGLTVLASTAALAGVMGLTLVRPALNTGAPVIPRPDAISMLMLVIAVWGIVSAFVMPRLFAGEVEVISYARGVAGTRVSNDFTTVLVPLAPSSGNLSQPAYVLLSALILYAAVVVGRRYGTGALERGLYAAAVVNAGLGGLDLVGLEVVITPFQTANYAILTHHVLHGIPRVIGGFPEASAFAGTSAVFFAYFASRFLDLGRPADGALAAANGGLGIMALSSTGFLAIAAACGILGVRLLRDCAGRGMPRRVLAVALVGIAGCILLAVTPVGAMSAKFIDSLIFSKPDSESGLERGFWAMQGLRVGIDTFGLGAGLGSSRSNGWVSVWFANMGAVGLAMLVAFLWTALSFPGAARLERVERARFRAAWCALLTHLSGKLVSTTVVDPGPLFILVAAILITTRVRAHESHSRPARVSLAPVSGSQRAYWRPETGGSGGVALRSSGNATTGRPA